MFEHFSLRGIRAAVAAIRAAADKAGQPMRPIPLPAMLDGKRRNGMSAKSAYARARGAKFRNRKFPRAIGPGSYDEASPNQLENARRAVQNSGNMPVFPACTE